MSRRRLPLRAPAALVALAVLPGLACGDDSVAEVPSAGTVGHVGQLPPAFDVPGRPTADPGPPETTTSEPEPEPTIEMEPATTVAQREPADSSPPPSVAGRPLGPFGDLAGGNRILALGDSITAAIGPDHGGQLCEDLGRRGWELGVDAEQGRDIDAGRAALERRLAVDDRWDGAIVNLGSNYRDDPVAYASDLREILTALRPRPVIVVTVSEHEQAIAEVNFVIRDLTRDLDGVWVLEWSERTRADDTLTGEDGLHLSDRGREVLSVMLAARAGRAPGGGSAGGCVPVGELGDENGEDGDGDG